MHSEIELNTKSRKEKRIDSLDFEVCVMTKSIWDVMRKEMTDRTSEDMTKSLAREPGFHWLLDLKREMISEGENSFSNGIVIYCYLDQLNLSPTHSFRLRHTKEGNSSSNIIIAVSSQPLVLPFLYSDFARVSFSRYNCLRQASVSSPSRVRPSSNVRITRKGREKDPMRDMVNMHLFSNNNNNSNMSMVCPVSWEVIFLASPFEVIQGSKTYSCQDSWPQRQKGLWEVFVVVDSLRNSFCIHKRDGERGIMSLIFLHDIPRLLLFITTADSGFAVVVWVTSDSTWKIEKRNRSASSCMDIRSSNFYGLSLWHLSTRKRLFLPHVSSPLSRSKRSKRWKQKNIRC